MTAEVPNKLEEGQLLAICTAYEQGYGKGFQGSERSNPYGKSWQCDEAWQYGYEEGRLAKEGCVQGEYL